MLKLYSVIRPSDQSSYSFANLRSTSVLRFSTLVSSALCLLALAASSCSLPFSSRCRSSVSSCANRDASRPYWKPRAKGLHPSGHPHIFLENGTQTVKMQFDTFPQKIQNRCNLHPCEDEKYSGLLCRAHNVLLIAFGIYLIPYFSMI